MGNLTPNTCSLSLGFLWKLSVFSEEYWECLRRPYQSMWGQKSQSGPHPRELTLPFSTCPENSAMQMLKDPLARKANAQVFPETERLQATAVHQTETEPIRYRLSILFQGLNTMTVRQKPSLQHLSFPQNHNSQLNSSSWARWIRELFTSKTHVRLNRRLRIRPEHAYSKSRKRA